MLYLHRSERADALLGALAQVLVRPLADPMAAEILCVPSRGVERWISQGLAVRLGATRSGAGDGISANIDFPFPAGVFGDVVAKATGLDPRLDPWNNGEAFWALVARIDANMDSGWMGLVSSQIRAARDHGCANRVGTARYIWDLFCRYHQQRPQMVSAWAGGADTGPTGQRLGDQQRWQAQLWRQVRDELGVPSPPERIGAVCDSLDTAEGAGELDLPERISAFGLTRLPDAQVQILTALARHRDVHLFLLHPSPKLWQQLAESMGEAVWPKSRVRAQASTGQLSANPLLASWGRDSRELQLVLASHTQSQAVLDRHYPVPDLSADRGGGSRTLLQRLQDDIRHNRVPVGAPFAQIDSDARPLCDPASDTSVQVHACHGNARQVQVLRDAVLHLLASDPTLEPRDIVIMCPDVDSFAPQISATFGAVPELRVRLADRSAAQTNPLISTVALLLSLLDSRFTATDVVGLLSTVPVRQRFGFSDDDLERIAHWVDEAGIRWGLDQRQRARWQLADTGANTWSAGLDRILLGVAMADEELRVVGGAVPLDDVRSADIELAGRLAEFVERLGQCAAFFAGEFTLTEGVSRLLEAVDQLTATTVADALQRQQLQRMVDEVAPDGVDRVGTTASAALLNFVEFRDIVRATWSGRPTRANFRTGHITVCTLTPMRSVPHRVVCLLGLDDGAFPRANRVFGDDLTAEPPFIGDQDRRSEDRQLLLDALLAATESVVITYSGRDERSNAVKQPSVPLAELLSVIDATVRVERPDHDIVVHHPLQSFDPRNFERGRLVKGRVWSYDEDAFAASTALLASRTPRGPFLPELLPALPNRTVDVGALVQFVQHPTRSFVETRLGLDLAKASEARTDEFEVQMGGLLSWQAAEPLIEALSAISDDDSIPEAGLAWHRWQSAAGALPPGSIATSELRTIFTRAAAIARLVRVARDGHRPTTVPVRVALADDRWLLGSVSGVCGNRLVAMTYSSLDHGSDGARELRGKNRIGLWVKLLALGLARPDTRWQGILVGTDHRPRDKGSQPGPLMLRLSLPENPGQVLSRILELYDRGMRQPLPLYCDTSAAYADAVRFANPHKRMANTWVTGFDSPKEDQDAYNLRVLDPMPTVEDLLADPQFVACGHELWDDLLAHEQVLSQAQLEADQAVAP